MKTRTGYIVLFGHRYEGLTTPDPDLYPKYTARVIWTKKAAERRAEQPAKFGFTKSDAYGEVIEVEVPV